VVARPVRVALDGDGRFAIAAVVPGRTWIAATGPGFGTNGRAVDLAAGEVAEVEIALPRSATIAGTVVDAAGAPLAFASVHTGARGQLQGRATITDARGAFRLDDVSPGAVVVTASDYQGAFASALLECGPGTEIAWNPRAQRGPLALRGRVRAADGRPLVGAWLVCRRSDGTTVLQLGADGRFDVPISERIAAQPLNVAIYDRDPRGPRDVLLGMPLAEQQMLPGGDEAEIRVPAAAGPVAWVRGRLVDDTGLLPRSSVFLRCLANDCAWLVQPGAGDGAFAVGPVPAGEYWVFVAADDGHHRFGPFAVGAGRTSDLGVLQLLEPAGSRPTSARFHTQLAFAHAWDVSPTEAVHVEIRDAERRLVACHDFRGHGASLWTRYVMLPPGRCLLRATTESGVESECAIDVLPERGQVRSVLVPLVSRREQRR
jgi:hypothetical protein